MLFGWSIILLLALEELAYNPPFLSLLEVFSFSFSFLICPVASGGLDVYITSFQHLIVRLTGETHGVNAISPLIHSIFTATLSKAFVFPFWSKYLLDIHLSLLLADLPASTNSDKSNVISPSGISSCSSLVLVFVIFEDNEVVDEEADMFPETARRRPLLCGSSRGPMFEEEDED